LDPRNLAEEGKKGSNLETEEDLQGSRVEKMISRREESAFNSGFEWKTEK
jgi:hypothetical protein